MKKITMDFKLNEIRRFIRSVLNEYVTNDMVYLKDYFKMPEERKKQYLPFSYYQFFIDFLDEEGVEFAHPQGIDDDLDLMYWLEDNNRELFDRYANYLYEKIKKSNLPIRDEEYPAWSFFSDNPEVIKNQWLAHFTKYPEEIAREGFRYGVSEMDKLGLTTYLSDFEKKIRRI